MVKQANLDKDTIKELVKAAHLAKNNAYVPYSDFRVGAALLTMDGQVYTGCNVENASYGLTNCAERTAIFKAVSEGYRQFQAIAIAADTDEYCSPCGACRQVIAEFGQDIVVIQSNKLGEYIINTIQELLPGSFTGNVLGKEPVE